MMSFHWKYREHILFSLNLVITFIIVEMQSPSGMIETQRATILVNVRNRGMFKVILVNNVDEEGQQPLLNLGRGSNPFTHDKSTCH